MELLILTETASLKFFICISPPISIPNARLVPFMSILTFGRLNENIETCSINSALSFFVGILSAYSVTAEEVARAFATADLSLTIPSFSSTFFKISSSESLITPSSSAFADPYTSSSEYTSSAFGVTTSRTRNSPVKISFPTTYCIVSLFAAITLQI